MILCCGEALIDMLPRETVGREPCFAPHAGGAVFNTAVALGRLGASAGFLSGLSWDFFGDLLRKNLGDSGVDVSLAVTSDRPTTLAFVRLVDGQADYAFYDENTAGRMLSADELPALPETVACLFFGGISLVGEPAATAYEALATREAGTRTIMLDPNIRPGFIRDEAAYRARIGRMLALADIVKLSDEDLHWLEGRGTIAELATGLRQQGPRLVLITEGAKGATAYTDGLAVSMTAPRVTVADTVGAGDTFNAGILAALDRIGRLGKASVAHLGEADLRAALDLAVRAAAVTVSRPGANPPWLSEL